MDVGFADSAPRARSKAAVEQRVGIPIRFCTGDRLGKSSKNAPCDGTSYGTTFIYCTFILVCMSIINRVQDCKYRTSESARLLTRSGRAAGPRASAAVVARRDSSEITATAWLFFFLLFSAGVVTRVPVRSASSSVHQMAGELAYQMEPAHQMELGGCTVRAFTTCMQVQLEKKYGAVLDEHYCRTVLAAATGNGSVGPGQVAEVINSAARGIKLRSAPPQIGRSVVVRSPSGTPRPCMVIESRDGSIKVHYTGFDTRFDEWLALGDPRLPAELTMQLYQIRVAGSTASDFDQLCDSAHTRDRLGHFAVAVVRTGPFGQDLQAVAAHTVLQEHADEVVLATSSWGGIDRQDKVTRVNYHSHFTAEFEIVGCYDGDTGACSVPEVTSTYRSILQENQDGRTVGHKNRHASEQFQPQPPPPHQSQSPGLHHQSERSFKDNRDKHIDKWFQTQTDSGRDMDDELHHALDIDEDAEDFRYEVHIFSEPDDSTGLVLCDGSDGIEVSDIEPNSLACIHRACCPGMLLVRLVSAGVERPIKNMSADGVQAMLDSRSELRLIFEHPWQRYLNEQHEEYYYNSLTDEVTRHRPRELNAVVSAMRRSGQRQIQNVSSERISAGGRSNSTRSWYGDNDSSRSSSRSSHSHRSENSRSRSPSRGGRRRRSPTNDEYYKGQHVMYDSKRHGQWVPAVVERVHSDGFIRLDIKRAADPRHIRSR